MFAGIYLKSVKGRERERLNARIREGDEERETTRPLHRLLFVGCLNAADRKMCVRVCVSLSMFSRHVGPGVTVEYDACCHKGLVLIHHTEPGHFSCTEVHTENLNSLGCFLSE